MDKLEQQYSNVQLKSIKLWNPQNTAQGTKKAVCVIQSFLLRSILRTSKNK